MRSRRSSIINVWGSWGGSRFFHRRAGCRTKYFHASKYGRRWRKTARPHLFPPHEPENWSIDFRRLARSHPSPLIPLPVEGRGRRERSPSLFLWLSALLRRRAEDCPPYQIVAQGRFRSYRPLGFGGKLPGPALVGLAPAQAIKFRAFSPNPALPTICSNFRAEPRRNIPVFVQRHFFRLEEFCLSPLIVLPAARD